MSGTLKRHIRFVRTNNGNTSYTDDFGEVGSSGYLYTNTNISTTGLTLVAGGLTGALAMSGTYSRNETSYILPAGMEILYPSEIAHPKKMEFQMSVGTYPLTEGLRNTQISGSGCTASLDGKQIQQLVSPFSQTNDNIGEKIIWENDTIKNSTRNSKWNFKLTLGGTWIALHGVVMHWVDITLYYDAFNCLITSEGNGIKNLSVSNTGYLVTGQTATYNCDLVRGGVFEGWYDANTGNLVSTDLTHTVTIDNQDISLVAKASFDTSQTFLSLKQNGQYKKVKNVWVKENGIYIKKDVNEIADLHSTSMKYIDLTTT